MMVFMVVLIAECKLQSSSQPIVIVREGETRY
jgi:hypothetical protein